MPPVDLRDQQQAHECCIVFSRVAVALGRCRKEENKRSIIDNMPCHGDAVADAEHLSKCCAYSLCIYDALQWLIINDVSVCIRRR